MVETDQRLTLALVGCGSIAEKGILPHLALQGIEVEAVCDISQSRVDLLADQFSIANCYTDYPQLLQNPAIDAVIIASPIGFHYEQVRAALQAGKHVYAQKTMTETAVQARELMELAERQNRVLAASPGQILLPAIAKAAELIADNQIGTLYSALSVNWAPGHEWEPGREDTSNPALNPRWYYQPGAGPLRDMGIYALHTLISLFGDVDEVFAYGNTPVAEKFWGDHAIAVDTPDNYSVSLRFHRGVLAQVVTGYCSMPALLGWGHLSIVGSSGAIDVRRIPGCGSRYELLLQKNDRREPLHLTFGAGLGEASDAIDEAHVALDIVDFIDAVKRGRTPGASAATATQAIAVVEAIERSVAIQRPVAVRV